MPNITPRPGAKLRGAVSSADLNQADIAAVLDLSPSQISARFTGRIAWRINELQAIAEHLGVPVASLIDEPTEAPAVAS